MSYGSCPGSDPLPGQWSALLLPGKSSSESQCTLR